MDIIESDTFLKLYAQRLGLPEEYLLDVQPTLELLCNLQERQLFHIPFENLAQHGAAGGPVDLNLPDIAHKILVRRRGGFCLELNSLYAHLLRQCGFVVTIIEATVFKNETFDGVSPSHVCLMVEITENNSDDDCDYSSSSQLYYVDVGFGEPPLHPLQMMRFEHQEQKLIITPEGMRSRLVPTDNGDAVLEWHQNGRWEPRLKWKIPDKTTKSLSLQDMDCILQEVSKETSIFSKKLVVCRLTRDQKHTVAGSTYKITGSPRFPMVECINTTVPIQKTEGLPLKQIQEILLQEFGIPLAETMSLQLDKSNQIDSADIWATW
ncbi:arylamine N-acetyltransferase 1 [Nitzschia inconspicua]|uniref:Arylamine N-acetyltransferase 1 n=1 Tax=Nitzschia inconspicua TaxID=303405 RepID=A0A9K3L332_9STRA|nr:arylamine N-acetyltransferase 1 [Nitzschia inconspicua]